MNLTSSSNIAKTSPRNEELIETDLSTKTVSNKKRLWIVLLVITLVFVGGYFVGAYIIDKITNLEPSNPSDPSIGNPLAYDGLQFKNKEELEAFLMPPEDTKSTWVCGIHNPGHVARKGENMKEHTEKYICKNWQRLILNQKSDQ